MTSSLSPSSTVRKPSKAHWTEAYHRAFVDVCLEQVSKGNRPGTHLNKVGWENAIKKFTKKTGLNYDRKQLKNHWDATKKSWIIWNKLMKNTTELGWDHNKETIDATPEFWDDYIKTNPEASKFRERGLLFSNDLNVLFAGTSATGHDARAPSQVTLPTEITISPQNNDDPELVLNTQPQVYLVEESNEPVDDSPAILSPNVGSSNNPKRKRKSSASRSHIQCICEAVEESCTVVNSRVFHKASVQDCMNILKKMPEIERGSALYLFACDRFLREAVRDLWVAFDGNDVRLSWLMLHYEKAQNRNEPRCCTP